MPAHAPMTATLVAVSVSRGATYDVVLLAHVLAAVVGFGAVCVAGAYAVVLGRSGPIPESVSRYYRPGVNWAGRILFLVPVLGFVLLGMNHGAHAYSSSDEWVIVGLILWAAAALAGEVVLWPAEQGLQQLVAGGAWDGSAHRPLRLRAAWTSAALMIIFVLAMVVMVAKP